nr:GNAT family N-acetyltransferase [Paenibacillus hamazuiensis]
MPVKSDVVLLRRTAGNDLDYVLQTEQDPENQPFILSWPREKHLEAIDSSDHLHLIIESPDGSRVGYVILAGLENRNHCTELLRIAVSDKGRGYGKEAIRLIQEYVFDSLKAHRLWLDVKEHNQRARKLYEKAGFATEGKLRDCIRNGDSYESLVIMGLLEPNYRLFNRICQGAE